ncbi:hypothetical protein LB467_13140 [Salegentibacter sp. JZCK2]|uniref:sensor histidine kinase n=1 Tax=Salegentibacter tibetensis TaxID=2873600 RepID=UPI001CCA23C8|nr:ATP-binding protein [Salegentibacter tibetensis]MBZ9730634.1 hypothetical protein [Salegentibacter tibetensis]
MKTAGLYELETVYEATIRALTDFSHDIDFDETFLREIFASSSQITSTAYHESGSEIAEIRKLLKQYIKTAENSSVKPSTQCTSIFKSYAPDGNSAVYVDKLEYFFGSSQKIVLSLSTTLFKMEQGWRVVNLHVSTPALNPEGENPFLKKESKKEVKPIEKSLKEDNPALREALEQITSIQTQLIRQEKLASLGKLAAGIAHEIKNPLNFVINFSDLSSELLDEAVNELDTLDQSEAKQEITAILEDVKTNLEKINQHGTRADSIVKSMLKHSRGGNGKPEAVKINDLIREYVNLSFHGMRAGKKPINVSIDLELDDRIAEIPLIQEDFSRVILNLCNNAFDAMREKLQNTLEKNTYSPRLTVRTIPEINFIRIEVEDNGPGIPEEIKSKILQPFFTTKKGNEGTGLGLSITQDIIKAHQGRLEIYSEEGSLSRFIVQLPCKK